MIAAKILSTEEYLSTLPAPSEVPKLTQAQILRLYQDDARGDNVRDRPERQRWNGDFTERGLLRL